MAAENLRNELKPARCSVPLLRFQPRRPPFKDNPKLREALTLAIDRDIITNKIAVPAKPHLRHRAAGYRRLQLPPPAYTGLSQQERDERASKQLYAEAGYSKTNRSKSNCSTTPAKTTKKSAIAITAMWKKHWV